jgi:hypothetical protein
MSGATYAGEDKLGRNQDSPLARPVDLDQLRSHSAKKLSKGKHELVGTNHEATNLERSQFGDVGDQNGLSKTNAETDEDSSSEPGLPVVGSNLKDGPSEEDCDGSHHRFPV